jgi:ABC-2 type transport system permease protein
VTVAALTASQLRYVNKVFWRNPASAFFTFAFPLMFLTIFTALLGGGEVRIGGRLIQQSTYATAMIYFGAQVLHSLLVALLLVAITVAYGRLVYDAAVPTGTSWAGSW